MPIRDVETFFPVLDGPPRVLSNRGANGIDGTVAAALGIAASGTPTTLLIGDVALVHDAGALLSARRLGLDLVIVLIDNGGGGIFDFLPVAGQTDHFERHIATPTGVDFEQLAAAAGFDYAPIADPADLAAELRAGGLRLLHARTDRAENVALHRACWDALRTQ
jgi:2-succinyl-5-enolpyruvyl-6-hydroxy-3-cyclohexene-1-carboxylate synthase